MRDFLSFMEGISIGFGVVHLIIANWVLSAVGFIAAVAFTFINKRKS